MPLQGLMMKAFFLFFISSSFALQHAYLEAFIHKAFDPIFGKVFLQEYLAENDFCEDTLHEMDLHKWSQKAKQKSSPWLTKLRQEDFRPILKRISITVSNWMHVIDKEEYMVRSDVVHECASKCKFVCDSLFKRYTQVERVGQAILNQEFLNLVFKVQLTTKTAKLKQERYFELLNKASEQMERTYINNRHYLVKISLYNYEKVSIIARMLFKSSEASELPVTTPCPTKSFQNAKEALRIVNTARYNLLPPFDVYIKSREEAMIGACSDLHTFSTTILNKWPKGKARTILQNCLILEVYPHTVKSSGKGDHSIPVDLSFPLPLSISREIRALANNMTFDEIMNILEACREYRKVVRILNGFAHMAEQMSAFDISSKRQNICEEFTSKLPSRRLPPNVANLLCMHVRILRYALEYVPEQVHYSNIPVTKKAQIGMERDYLQKLAYWINEVTRVVPEAKRKAHFQLMFRFITQEVRCLIPEDQRELVLMTTVLMIEGGLKAYYSEKIN